MSDGIFIFDCEGDGLTPTKIHCLSVSNLDGEIFSTTNYDDIRKFFENAKVVIGHNITRFDIPVLERILKIKITAKLVDTLAVSWYLNPQEKKHGLEIYGEKYGLYKTFIDDWDNLSSEKYIERCERDVKINFRLWNEQYTYLKELYNGVDADIWKLLDYLSFKMHCARLQEESGWKVDVPYTKKALEELEALQKEKVNILVKVMPKVPIKKKKSKPKRFINKDGNFTKLGLQWIDLLNSMDLPISHEDDIEIIDGYEEPNINSPDQVKSWLFSLGWEPDVFKYVKDKTTGKDRAIPQINSDKEDGVCQSILDLQDKEPTVLELDSLGVINHRIGILKGILNNIDENEFVKAQVKGLTNTLRFKHTTVVNFPKPNKPYAGSIRGALIASKGKLLCGSDMSGLEDRIKQHFIYPHDPDYVESMNQPDFDPHIIIANMADMMTLDQVARYKSGDKTDKPIRDIAKNGNYACQYGAGVPKLMLTCKIGREQAARLHKAYWDLNWAIKVIADEQVYKTVGDQMWLLNPISGFWYSLRQVKDIFSTLVQGTASFVFDVWLGFVLSQREQLTAQFHDEFVLCADIGEEEKLREIITYAIDETNKFLGLNRELGVDIQFGHRYSDIH